MELSEIDKKIEELLNNPEALKSIHPNKNTVYDLRNQDKRTVSYDKKVGFLARAGLLQFKDDESRCTEI